MRSTLFKISNLFRRLFVPGLRYSQYVYEDAIREEMIPERSWLDLGCGHHLLPEWRYEEEKELLGACSFVVGLDYDMLSLKKARTIKHLLRGSISELAFKDNQFGFMTSNMVVEHLDDAEKQFAEIYRVLEPGGVFLFHTVNMDGYKTLFARLLPEFLKKPLARLLEDRAAEDVFPAHYQANSTKQIEAIATQVGFEVKKIHLFNNVAEFSVFPPFAFFEYIWIRILETNAMREWRTNIICALVKPANPKD